MAQLAQQDRPRATGAHGQIWGGLLLLVALPLLLVAGERIFGLVQDRDAARAWVQSLGIMAAPAYIALYVAQVLDDSYLSYSRRGFLSRRLDRRASAQAGTRGVRRSGAQLGVWHLRL